MKTGQVVEQDGKQSEKPEPQNLTEERDQESKTGIGLEDSNTPLNNDSLSSSSEKKIIDSDKEHPASEEIAYVLKDCLPQKSLGMICAPIGVSKEQFAIQLLYALLNNQEVFGLKPTKRFSVAYFASVDSKELCILRLVNTVAHLEGKLFNINNIKCHTSIVDTNLYDENNKIVDHVFPLFNNVNNTPCIVSKNINFLKNFVHKYNIEVLFLDSLNTLTGFLEEDCNYHMYFVFTILNKIAKSLGITIIFLYTIKEISDKDGVINKKKIKNEFYSPNFRGSNIIIKFVDWIYCLINIHDLSAIKLFSDRIKKGKTGHFLAGCTVKSKYDTSDKVHYFEIMSGGYINEITSVVKPQS